MTRDDILDQAIALWFDPRSALLAPGEHGRILDERRKVEALAEALADQHWLGLVFSYLPTHFNRTRLCLLAGETVA